MTDGEWEEFELGPVVSNSGGVYATLNRRGNIYLNRTAFEKLGEPEQVVLLYDRRRSRIGITRAEAAKRNAFRLRRKDAGRSGSRVIYAANFCRHYRIKTDQTYAFPAAEVDRQGILILDLNSVSPPPRRG